MSVFEDTVNRLIFKEEAGSKDESNKPEALPEKPGFLHLLR